MKSGEGNSWVDRLVESIVEGTDVVWPDPIPDEDARAEPVPESGTEILAGLRRIARLERRFRESRNTAPSKEKLGTWGPLDLTGVLGSGSYGTVYEAYDPALRRRVALKLWKHVDEGGEGRDRDLLVEAQRLARVRHPNVLTVHGAAVHEGRAGYWSDLLEGPSLAGWIGQHPTLGFSEAIVIGLEVCRALAAVHAEGLVHGDVKAANIIRMPDGRHVLLDFGSSLFEESESPLTASPATAAPETLISGISSRGSDLYSLGALLFFLLTGRYPVPGVDRAEVATAHREGERVYLRDLRPDLPSALVDVVERCLAAEPSLRFRTSGHLERELIGALGAPRSTGRGGADAADTATITGAPGVETVANQSQPFDAAVPLIGRRTELAWLSEQLRKHRGAWIVGAPGIGKTRLAHALAGTLDDSYPSGACVVDLRRVEDGPSLTVALLRALELEARSETPESALWRYLAHSDHLLVLDNCEGAQRWVEQLANRLLTGSAHAILTTSRARSRVQPDWTLSLGSLPVPEDGADRSDEPRVATESEVFFLECLRRTVPGVQTTGEEEILVADICRRLQGHPLALELTAARGRWQSLEEVSSELELALGTTASGLGMAELLVPVVKSSYDRLSPEGRSSFRAFGVFPGSFTHTAAVSLLPARQNGSGDPLLELLDSSLLETVPRRAGRPPRFQFHPFVRSFARDLLEEGELDNYDTAYLDHYMEFAERSGIQTWRRRPSRPALALEEEWENVRDCLARAERAGDPRIPTVARALGRFLSICSDRSFAREWIGRVSNAYEDDPELALMAVLCEGVEGDRETTLEFARRARRLYRDRGDEVGLARLGAVARESETLNERAAMMREGMRHLEAEGDTFFLLRAMTGASQIHRDAGDLDEAEVWIRRAEHRARAAEDELALQFVLHSLSLVADARGDFELERRCYEEILSFELVPPLNRTSTLFNLGVNAVMEKDWPSARAYFEESLLLARKCGLELHVSACQANLAEIEDDQYDPWRHREVSLDQVRSHLERGAEENAVEVLTGVARASLRLGRIEETARIIGFVRQSWERGHTPGTFALSYLNELEEEGRSVNSAGWKRWLAEGRTLSIQALLDDL